MTGADVQGLVIRVSDLIPPHCPWGLRHWWRQHNLDFKDFLANGIDAARLLETGDELARQAVARKVEAACGQ